MRRRGWKRWRTYLLSVTLGVIALFAVLLVLTHGAWIEAYEDWKNPDRIKYWHIAPF